MFRASILSVILSLTFLAIPACDTGSGDELQAVIMVRPLRPAPVAVNGGDAKKYFRIKCASCHGMNGTGDGPDASTLGAQPRAFVDSSWQESLSDEALRKIITDGGAALGKSSQMPAHSELKTRPKLLRELVQTVREFKRDRQLSSSPSP